MNPSTAAPSQGLALVTVIGGVATVYTHGPVKVALVDLDNLSAGDPLPELNSNVWQDLVHKAGLKPGQDVRFVDVATQGQSLP